MTASSSLEHVPACPTCQATNLETEYADLTDGVFGVPGSWTLRRCIQCGTWLLSPRLPASRLSEAYASYHTHAAAGIGEPVNLAQRIRRTLRDGYLQKRYRVRSSETARRVGLVIPRVMPMLRADRYARELELPRAEARLLDVGCGNGSFVATARSFGWDAIGVDPDIVVVREARERHIPVEQGTIFDVRNENFDAITLAHVIEHVPDPRGVIGRAFDLLRPGGVLWIATPNTKSLGHRIFGRHWRSLDIPRHLTLFDYATLRRLFAECGFVDIRRGTPGPFAQTIFPESEELRMQTGAQGRRHIRIASKAADALRYVHPGLAEEVVVLARRPVG